VKPITTTDDVLAALQRGASIVLSTSGGKDCQAMIQAVLREKKRRGWTGEVYLLHADLGEMEWVETPVFVEAQAREHVLPLHIVRHKKYDLLEGIIQRHIKRPDAVPFPDAKNRYCTSDWKRGPINVWIRNHFKENHEVVVCIGLRAEESPARRKKPVSQLRKGCQAPTKNRVVYDWLPIHDWTFEDVWNEIGYSLEELKAIQEECLTLRLNNKNPYAYLFNIGWKAHVAYALGNERLSCAMCVLGCKGDLQNGAENRPLTFQKLVDLEISSGKSFKQGKPLWAVAPDLLRNDQKAHYLIPLTA
jgi:3'-phosphoadenosine 5'-phosphosulfate sulfotransferase (PAPS reductase)/FAD synthetase